MPKNYQQLISADFAENFVYQRAKQSQALLRPDSKESDVLYHLVAKEMVRNDPPLIIPYVEVTISPQCTLNCANCANLMQHYSAQNGYKSSS